MTADRAKAWRTWYLQASEQDQLTAAQTILDNTHIAWRCRSHAHDRYLREARQTGAIPAHAGTQPAGPPHTTPCQPTEQPDTPHQLTEEDPPGHG
jgi:hypothetical protein